MSYEVKVGSEEKDTDRIRYSTEVQSSRTDGSFTMVRLVTSGERRRVVSKQDSRLRLMRRLRGFFIQEEGEEALVAFEKDGKFIKYHLPLRYFKEGNVTAENQPFEFDEFETTVSGVVLRGYKVRAAAQPKDSYSAPLKLDARSEENLRFILANAKRPKG